jgi:hypothetical protein
MYWQGLWFAPRDWFTSRGVFFCDGRELKTSSCPASAIRLRRIARTKVCRASTSLQPCNKKDVDGRDKPGHDAECGIEDLVLPALVAGIHVFTTWRQRKTWMVERP